MSACAPAHSSRSHTTPLPAVCGRAAKPRPVVLILASYWTTGLSDGRERGVPGSAAADREPTTQRCGRRRRAQTRGILRVFANGALRSRKALNPPRERTLNRFGNSSRSSSSGSVGADNFPSAFSPFNCRIPRLGRVEYSAKKKKNNDCLNIFILYYTSFFFPCLPTSLPVFLY